MATGSASPYVWKWTNCVGTTMNEEAAKATTT